MVKAEARQASDPAGAADVNAALAHHIQAAQQVAYDLWLWPDLRVVYAFDLLANQRYYAYPSKPAVGRIAQIGVINAGCFYPIDRGISIEDYALCDPETAREPIVRRWDLARTDIDEQAIEVWPVPSVAAGKLWLIGMRPLRPLVHDNDVCDLDPLMIAVYAAGMFMESVNMNVSQVLKARAEARARVLLGQQNISGPFVLGGNRDARLNKLPLRDGYMR